MKRDLHLKVFKLFDSDNSGKMDVTEMVDVRPPECRRAGHDFNKHAAASSMRIVVVE